MKISLLSHKKKKKEKNLEIKFHYFCSHEEIKDERFYLKMPQITINFEIYLLKIRSDLIEFMYLLPPLILALNRIAVAIVTANFLR